MQASFSAARYWLNSSLLSLKQNVAGRRAGALRPYVKFAQEHPLDGRRP
jgi:hypothetical protein